MALLLQAKKISKVYGEPPNELYALNNIDLTIKDGEFVAIIGASGSGKSTLMNILGCLDTPTHGRYLLEGKDVSRLSEGNLAEIRNRKLGFVFQGFNLLPRTSALKNVELPLIYGGVGKKERKERASKLLKQLGLGEKINSTPNKLSGGQQQRVAIARALINNPKVIFADEPTGNLDTKTSSEIIDIFAKLNRDGKTIIMVTHEPEIAARAKRIIRMMDGKIKSDTEK